MPARATMEMVMTPYPYSIDIDAHALSAQSLMAQFKIHHLPVTAKGQPVGVVSEWGIRRAEEKGLDLSVGGAARVRDVCSRNILIVAPDDILIDVLGLMANRHVEAVLILLVGTLKGIYTFTDACRGYAALLGAQK
ncbi:MAG: CBS domain-containing protein [Acidiferrobacterales bacterium]